MSQSSDDHKGGRSPKPARYDVLTAEQRSRCMSRIRGKDTAPELAVRKALWRLGYRYRCNYALPGRPDIVFPGPRVAVFIDGCFWHACPNHGVLPKTRRSFWAQKISANVERDQRTSRELQYAGWIVLRIWEHEIQRDPEAAVERVRSTLDAARSQ